jgi:hypothetical protein
LRNWLFADANRYGNTYAGSRLVVEPVAYSHPHPHTHTHAYHHTDAHTESQPQSNSDRGR